MHSELSYFFSTTILLIFPVNNPGFGAIDMFCAGNDKSSKEVARKLAQDIGFDDCWDFGGDDKVELLEKLALSWINLAIMQGHGRGLAFKVLKR